MATIRTGIELEDRFSVPMANIVSSVNMGMAAIEQMQSVMNTSVDMPIADGITEQAERSCSAITQIEARYNALLRKQADAQNAAQSMNIVSPMAASQIHSVDEKLRQIGAEIAYMQNNPFELDNASIELQAEAILNAMKKIEDTQERVSEGLSQAGVPMPEIAWKSDDLEVFGGTGVERFQQEVAGVNTLIDQVISKQAQIAVQAASTNIFPPQAITDMSNVQDRIQAIQKRISAIENNPLNFGTDTANAELEQLRASIGQMITDQETLNAAVENMDVEAANQAYLRLSANASNTERYIRDNVDEQGRFNREIEEGAAEASNLMGMIKGALAAYTGIAGIKKAISFIHDCTEAFNTQYNAETQLVSVLANMLDADFVAQFEVEANADTSGAIAEINAIESNVDDVTVNVSAESKALTAAFDQIKDKASEIQSEGIYGDETMIAAAGEFATYFTDVDAITTMMDTLSNYAMGMSGGGELDTTAMVDYATNLGKIMSGAYDAMTKKGFEFTDAQKAVIEGTATEAELASVLGDGWADMTSDMQAAATISQIIDESWAGLYESMSNTPQGKIIQMTNAWSDMTEVVGGQLYPYVILFVDTINNNWGTIESVVNGITTALQVVLGALNWIFEGAMTVANAIIDNWSWISPIIYGVAGALAVYYGWQLAVNILDAITKGIKIALCIASYAHAAATGKEASATAIATAAQYNLNTAMYACPIVWIIVLIIALVALFYAAVAAVNHFAGTSVSATGIICGVFMGALAFIGNIFVALWNLAVDVFVLIYNLVASVANFIGNVFTDPVGAICRLFFDLADTVLGILQALASAIDTIFGSNLAGAVQGWRDSLSGWVDNTFGEGVEVMAKTNLDDMKLGRFDIDAALNAGYSFGEGIDESIANFDPSSLFGTTDIPSPEDYISNFANNVSDISDDTSEIADNTSASSEDLELLREIAERQAINQFTTAELKIEFTSNATVNSDMDIDGMVNTFEERLKEALTTTAEGVHI